MGKRKYTSYKSPRCLLLDFANFPPTLRLMSTACQQGSTSAFELIFMGTGTSGSVPNISCLTAPPDVEPCLTCLSTLIPEGKKNIRRNTSAVIRTDGVDGNKVYVAGSGLADHLRSEVDYHLIPGQFSSIPERTFRPQRSNGFRNTACAVSMQCCLPTAMQMVSAYIHIAHHLPPILTPFSHERFRRSAGYATLGNFRRQG